VSSRRKWSSYQGVPPRSLKHLAYGATGAGNDAAAEEGNHQHRRRDGSIEERSCCCCCCCCYRCRVTSTTDESPRWCLVSSHPTPPRTIHWRGWAVLKRNSSEPCVCDGLNEIPCLPEIIKLSSIKSQQENENNAFHCLFGVICFY